MKCKPVALSTSNFAISSTRILDFRFSSASRSEEFSVAAVVT